MSRTRFVLSCLFKTAGYLLYPLAALFWAAGLALRWAVVAMAAAEEEEGGPSASSFLRVALWGLLWATLTVVATVNGSSWWGSAAGLYVLGAAAYDHLVYRWCEGDSDVYLPSSCVWAEARS